MGAELVVQTGLDSVYDRKVEMLDVDLYDCDTECRLASHQTCSEPESFLGHARQWLLARRVAGQC